MRHVLWMLLPLLAACQSESASPVSTVALAAPAAASGDYLRMKVDGVAWEADHDIFGAVHPKGYDKAVLIAGSFGPKDASEQAFNINLYDINAAGNYPVQTGNPKLHVAQLANLTPERFLSGGPMGFDMQVEIVEMQAAPTRLHVRFEGTLMGNDSHAVKITNGEFRYSE
ncbi:MAG: hypothetical protein IT475_11030 [Aquimonas sp.]|jgi:hypothetical protein|nr:hypothetical protein [Xanthomonadales bacterium]MCC6505965.1 hypothetical protein [Aquimonas sp.]